MSFLFNPPEIKHVCTSPCVCVWEGVSGFTITEGFCMFCFFNTPLAAHSQHTHKLPLWHESPSPKRFPPHPRSFNFSGVRNTITSSSLDILSGAAKENCKERASGRRGVSRNEGRCTGDKGRQLCDDDPEKKKGKKQFKWAELSNRVLNQLPTPEELPKPLQEESLSSASHTG